MAGRFRFTPSCCCGSGGPTCITPCVPDCGIVYEGFVLPSDNPYYDNQSFRVVDNRDDYYKCGDDEDYHHYSISAENTGDKVAPSLVNNNKSGWICRQTYTAGTVGATGTEDWLLGNFSLTESNIYNVWYDGYPHSNSLTWYKIVFLPIDTERINIDNFCFQVAEDTPENYRNALRLNIGSTDPEDYVVDKSDCGWTELIENCADNSDVWSWDSGLINADGLAQWLSQTCEGAHPCVNFIENRVYGFASWRLSNYGLPSSGWAGVDFRMPHAPSVVSGRIRCAYAKGYALPIIIDLPNDLSYALNTVVSVQSDLFADRGTYNRLDQYITPADTENDIPESEAQIRFENDTNIPTQWAVVTGNYFPTGVSRSDLLKLDKTCSNAERFAGEHLVYAEGKSCEAPSTLSHYRISHSFPLGVFTNIGQPETSEMFYDANGTPLVPRPLSGFTSVNDFVARASNFSDYNSFIIESRESGSSSNALIPLSGFYGGASALIPFDVTGKTIVKYCWAASFPGLFLMKREGNLYIAFSKGVGVCYYKSLTGNSHIRNSSNSFSPITGNGSRFQNGTSYPGRFFSQDYSIDYSNITAAEVGNLDNYDKFFETFSSADLGTGEAPYRILEYNGANWAIPYIPQSIISRLTAAYKTLYVAGGNASSSLVFYPMCPMSIIILYTENGV